MYTGKITSDIICLLVCTIWISLANCYLTGKEVRQEEFCRHGKSLQGFLDASKSDEKGGSTELCRAFSKSAPDLAKDAKKLIYPAPTL